MKKKLISVLLVLILIAGTFAGCGKSETSSYPVTVQGAIFGGSGTDSIEAELTFNPDWITKDSSEKYSAELAAFSAIVCDDTYFREKDLGRGTPNRVLTEGEDPEQYERSVLFETLGFTDVRYIESFKEKEYADDPNDSVTMTLAYTDMADKCDTFVVVIRGCFSSSEWYSIFDPGCDDEAYFGMSGEHSDWTDTTVMKGVDVASVRALEFIRGYIAEHDDPSRKNCVLVTGHSRGGSIAQKVGSELEDDPDVKSVTYTFNSAPVTTDPHAADYKTVFNIFDSGDFFSNVLPFGNGGWYRYGKDMSLAIADSADMLAEISELKGRDDYACASEDFLEEYGAAFGAIFPDRASLYETRSFTETFGDLAEAEERRLQLEALIGSDAGLGTEAFTSVSETVTLPDGGFSVTVEYCDAALLISIGRILSYGASMQTAAKELFAVNEDFCDLTDLIMENAASISGGHLLINSYVLAKHLK